MNLITVIEIQFEWVLMNSLRACPWKVPRLLGKKKIHEFELKNACIKKHT